MDLYGNSKYGSNGTLCPGYVSNLSLWDSGGVEGGGNVSASAVFNACNCTTWNSDTQDVRDHRACNNIVLLKRPEWLGRLYCTYAWSRAVLCAHSR